MVMVNVWAAISAEEALREVRIIFPEDYWAVGAETIVESPAMLTVKEGLSVSSEGIVIYMYPDEVMASCMSRTKSYEVCELI